MYFSILIKRISILNKYASFIINYSGAINNIPIPFNNMRALFKILSNDFLKGIINVYLRYFLCVLRPLAHAHFRQEAP